jgi:heme-degrading monooxygenase HmoA
MEKGKGLIARVWQGRVAAGQSEEYRRYLLENGTGPIRRTEGNLGVQVLVRSEGNETEFITISYWHSRDAIRAFAGENIESPHHLPRDADYLVELPKQVRHYEVAYNYIADVGERDL